MATLTRPRAEKLVTTQTAPPDTSIPAPFPREQYLETQYHAEAPANDELDSHLHEAQAGPSHVLQPEGEGSQVATDMNETSVSPF
jgi:hypothetical protein